MILSLESIDDIPVKPKQKPRPKLRPSSERIVAQALVNLQRNGACTNPSLKYSLPGIPIMNKLTDVDENSGGQ